MTPASWSVRDGTQANGRSTTTVEDTRPRPAPTQGGFSLPAGGSDPCGVQADDRAAVVAHVDGGP